MSDYLLEIRDLRTYFHIEDQVARAVDGVSLGVRPGETVGIVGESGCGKSVTALSALRLIPEPPGRIESGEIVFEGENLLEVDLETMRRLRGNQISMIFQEPMTSLNPVFRVGAQIVEALRLHQKMMPRAARARAIELLEEVGIPSPQQRVDEYPHQLSGGMKQRIMIAMALACRPKLLIADEPTTALDVTIQAQILELLRDLQRDHGMAVVLITHDLGVVAEMADRVVVMYAGKVVEEGTTHDIFASPSHPYTLGLFHSLPQLSGRHARLRTIEGDVPNPLRFPPGCRFHPRCAAAIEACRQEVPPLVDVRVGTRGAPVRSACIRIENGQLPGEVTRADAAVVTAGPIEASAPTDGGNGEGCLLELRSLVTHFPIRKGVFSRVVNHVRAVDDVSLTLRRGETLGLVGESGCGKTTVGRSILQLVPPTGGQVLYRGENIVQMDAERLRLIRREMQIIFQDPYGSLNPRIPIERIIAEGLEIHGIGTRRERRERVSEISRRVGLDPSIHLSRYPHEFSGGQRQRIGIARALALEPEFIVCDEAVSALDVSIQAQIINLLMDLQKERGYTYLFIAHDLSVIRHISDRVAVMYVGRLVEVGPVDRIFQNPRHPYTQALLAAVPVADPDRRQGREVLVGDVPSPVNPPRGCRFHTRCPQVMDVCREREPRAIDVEPEHVSWCFLDDPDVGPPGQE